MKICLGGEWGKKWSWGLKRAKVWQERSVAFTAFIIVFNSYIRLKCKIDISIANIVLLTSIYRIIFSLSDLPLNCAQIENTFPFGSFNHNLKF